MDNNFVHLIENFYNSEERLEEFLQGVEASVERHDFSPGYTYGGENDAGNFNKDTRSCDLKFMKDRMIAWETMDFITYLNDDFYGFDLRHNAVEIQYAEYEASEGGHFDWHHDVIPDNSRSDRKISATIQLSTQGEDYEGGEFEFANWHGGELPEYTRKRGSMIVFPSFLYHRVKPVTEGKRRALVLWFHGPTWR